MELAIRNDGPTTVIKVLEPRLDAVIAVQFKDRLKSAIGTGGDLVLLDLSDVTFMDSSGLGATVALRRFLRDGQRLELAALTAPVLRVFRLTRMDSVFTLHEGADHATDSAV